MAIIVDTNCFARVFSRTNKEHPEFAPVLDWILYGKGFLVYGGSKYIQELNECKKYLRFIRLLKDAKKVYICDCDKVDDLQAKYERMIDNPDFDDPHLPAIVRVSKCRLICSMDFRSVPFVTSRELYPKRFHLPHYYSSSRDVWLLTDANIDPSLKNYSRQLNKEVRDTIYRYTDKL